MSIKNSDLPPLYPFFPSFLREPANLGWGSGSIWPTRMKTTDYVFQPTSDLDMSV